MTLVQSHTVSRWQTLMTERIPLRIPYSNDDILDI